MIVDEPDAARPLPGAPEVLAELAKRYARVWVVSGRPASFLHGFLGDTGVRLSGLYGLEWVDDGRAVTHPSAERWRSTGEDGAGAAERHGPAGGVGGPGGGGGAGGGAPGAGGGVWGGGGGRWSPRHPGAPPRLERGGRRGADDEAPRPGLAVPPARKWVGLRPPVERDKGT